RGQSYDAVGVERPVHDYASRDGFGDEPMCQIRLRKLYSHQQAESAHRDDFTAAEATHAGADPISRAPRRFPPAPLDDRLKRRESGRTRQRMPTEGRDMSQRRIARELADQLVASAKRTQ